MHNIQLIILLVDFEATKRRTPATLCPSRDAPSDTSIAFLQLFVKCKVVRRYLFSSYVPKGIVISISSADVIMRFGNLRRRNQANSFVIKLYRTHSSFKTL